jgi:hypothetical protein
LSSVFSALSYSRLGFAAVVAAGDVVGRGSVELQIKKIVATCLCPRWEGLKGEDGKMTEA